MKITVENQALLQRIQDKKATLNFKMLEKERREKEKLLGNISEYPLQIYKNHYTNNKMPLETSSRNNFVFSSKSLEV